MSSTDRALMGQDAKSLPISDEEQERGALFRRFCPGGPPIEAEHPVDLGRTRGRSDDVDARPAEVR